MLSEIRGVRPGRAHLRHALPEETTLLAWESVFGQKVRRQQGKSKGEEPVHAPKRVGAVKKNRSWKRMNEAEKTGLLRDQAGLKIGEPHATTRKEVGTSTT